MGEIRMRPMGGTGAEVVRTYFNVSAGANSHTFSEFKGKHNLLGVSIGEGSDGGKYMFRVVDDVASWGNGYGSGASAFAYPATWNPDTGKFTLEQNNIFSYRKHIHAVAW